MTVARLLRAVPDVAPDLPHILADHELDTLPDVRWLVEGLLPDASLAILGGATQAYKSFLALDVACHIAAGRPWHGHAVRTGSVAYIAAEGGLGLRARQRAWKQVHGLDTALLPFYLIPHPIRMHEGREVDRLITGLEQFDVPELRLVVIDTAHRCRAPGRKENDENDVADFLANADRLRAHFGCTVLILHHLGATGERVRGSTAWEADVDCVLLAHRRGDVVRVTCQKQRDAEPGAPVQLQLVAIEGAPSAVLLPVAAPARVRDPGDGAHALLVALRGVAPASDATWRAAIGSTMGSRTYYRLKKSLLDAELVHVHNRQFSLTEQGMAVLTARQCHGTANAVSDMTATATSPVGAVAVSSSGSNCSPTDPRKEP